MKAARTTVAIAIAVGQYFICYAAGANEVTSGKVIRGITLRGNGTTGDFAGSNCENFRDEDLDQNSKITDASVNCRPNGEIDAVLRGLPARFNAYCVTDAPIKSAHLIQAPMPDNNNHCSLSSITPDDAIAQFKGAVWR